MYLDFEDHRPETPRVTPVISRREGVLLSLVIHLTLTLAYVLTPKGFFQSVPVRPIPPPQDNVKFVMMEPLVERVAPPRPNAESSDLDRRATTRERPPKIEDAQPFSRGTTPEKVEGAPPVEPPKGAEGSSDASRAQPPPPPTSTAILPPDPASPPRGSEGLRDSLRNLQRYLKDQNFANDRGGEAEQDAQISFDSKGVDFGWWLRRFVTQVKSNWFIPQAAISLSGRVVISFNVHRNGTITDLQILKGSGIASFDSAAFNALKMSNPTVSLPVEYPSDKVLFTVTFIYNERQHS